MNGASICRKRADGGFVRIARRSPPPPSGRSPRSATTAIKYGNRQPVEVSVDERNGAAILVVRDHGIGISPDSHERIFERFERAARTSAATGLGLGLWLVKRLVAAQGGDIAVESALGAGATFTVVLPRATT